MDASPEAGMACPSSMSYRVAVRKLPVRETALGSVVEAGKKTRRLDFGCDYIPRGMDSRCNHWVLIREVAGSPSPRLQTRSTIRVP